MFGLEQKVDKVNMSLDDIIKLNKKQNQNKNNKIGNNNKAKTFPPQKNADKGQQRRRGFNKNSGPNKPGPSKKAFGILDRSKSIKKKNIPTKKALILKDNQQKNKNVKPFATRRQPQQAQIIGNRRRKPNNNNRTKRFNEINSKQNINRPINITKMNNPTIASTVQIIKPSQRTNPSVTQKPKLQHNKIEKEKQSKIKMQTARKNVQKAKRLLIAKKKPVKQLMTQKYAIKMGVLRNTGLVPKSTQAKSKQQRILQQPKKQTIKESKPMFKVNIASRINKVRIQKAKIEQSFKKKAVMGQTRNSTLTRQRPQGGLSGTTSSRMVFLK